MKAYIDSFHLNEADLPAFSSQLLLFLYFVQLNHLPLSLSRPTSLLPSPAPPHSSERFPNEVRLTRDVYATLLTLSFTSALMGDSFIDDNTWLLRDFEQWPLAKPVKDLFLPLRRFQRYISRSCPGVPLVPSFPFSNGKPIFLVQISPISES